MSMCKCKKNEVADVTKAEKKCTAKKVIKVIAIIAAINGAVQLIAKAKQKKDAVNEEKNGNSNIKVYDVFMNGKSIKIEDEEFEGIVVKSVMGGVDIDLRNAIIKKNVYITIKNVMSGVSIRVPEGVNVKLESRDVLSGSDNLVPEYEGEDVPVIFVETKSYLSGLSIRPATNKKDEKTRDEYVEEDIFADVPSEEILKSASQSEKKAEAKSDSKEEKADASETFKEDVTENASKEKSPEKDASNVETEAKEVKEEATSEEASTAKEEEEKPEE